MCKFKYVLMLQQVYITNKISFCESRHQRLNETSSCNNYEDFPYNKMRICLKYSYGKRYSVSQEKNEQTLPHARHPYVFMKSNHINELTDVGEILN